MYTGVRGLASPRCLAVLFGVYVLPETYSSGFFWVVRFWLGSGYHSRWLWLLFHTSQCEGGPRMLRSILGQTKFMPVAIPQVQFLVKVICPLLSCLMLLVRQCRKLWIFRSCRSRYFYDPLYLAVIKTAFACGVQDCVTFLEDDF